MVATLKLGPLPGAQGSTYRLPVIREQLEGASENHVRGIPALRPDGARFIFREDLAGWVGGWPVAILPSPPHTRSEISLFRIGPRFHSGSFASSFLASAVLSLFHPSSRRVPQAFSGIAFASVLKPE